MSNGSFIDDLADIPGLNDMSRKPRDTGLRTSEEAENMTFEGDVGHDERPAKQRETYPCESCGGTGRYRGVRIHQTESRCFACSGRGYFYTSAKDRYAARAKSAQRKQNAKELAQGAFREANPGMIERLTEMSKWSGFANSMMQAFNQWDRLTDRQVAACLNMFAGADAKREEKAKVKEANSGVVDIGKIEAMFEVARSSGLKKLAFIADGLRIKPAKENSRNAGALYVTAGGDEYQGKIMGGRFYPVGSAQPGILDKLNAIALNPSQAARDYGKKTGVCCCCGRELTDPESIAAGIGPICASNWGL